MSILFISSLPRKTILVAVLIIPLAVAWSSFPACATAENRQKPILRLAMSGAFQQVLLLDEITSALDVEMVAGINELLTGLAASGMTMVGLLTISISPGRWPKRSAFSTKVESSNPERPARYWRTPAHRG